MAKLTRTQKYAGLRDVLANDKESSLETEELSEYQNRFSNISDKLSPSAGNNADLYAWKDFTDPTEDPTQNISEVNRTSSFNTPNRPMPSDASANTKSQINDYYSSILSDFDEFTDEPAKPLHPAREELKANRKKPEFVIPSYEEMTSGNTSYVVSPNEPQDIPFNYGNVNEQQRPQAPKQPAYQQPIDGKTYSEIIDVFENLMLILHPFMPFITEELWHNLRERGENESIMIAQMPQPKAENGADNLLARFELTRKVVEDVRRVRAEKNIAQKNAIELLVIKQDNAEIDAEMDSVIQKLCNISSIQYIKEKVSGTCSFIEQNTEYLIPIAQNINVEEELKKLNADLEYAEKFLQSVLKKLANERFVSNAPEQVVAVERKKQSDAEEKIKMLKEQIANLQ